MRLPGPAPAPPDPPELWAWEWRDGSYVEVAHVAGDEPYAVVDPFRVGVVPADLVR